MKQCTTIQMRDVQHILTSLKELDELYYTDLIAYEQQWQDIVQQVETLFPGFSLSHAEIYTQGQERVPTGGMKHVLLPKKAT